MGGRGREGREGGRRRGEGGGEREGMVGEGGRKREERVVCPSHLVGCKHQPIPTPLPV